MTAPACSNSAAAAVTASLTCGSTAMPQPASISRPTRSPFRSRSRSIQSIVAGGRDMSSRSSGWDSTAMAIAASVTVRVIGPAARPMKGGSIGTRPKLGFSPTSPHHAAGSRIDPPMSVPRWIGP